MLRELAETVDVYLVTGYTDLRQGIDGLAGIVQGNLSLDPFSRSLFLFCERRCDPAGRGLRLYAETKILLAVYYSYYA